MELNTIKITKDGHIATIMINRPEASNALNTQLAIDMYTAITHLEEDDNIWAVILTGAGEKAFCAGADLKERKTMDDAAYIAQRKLIIKAFKAVDKFPKPLIAAVNGAAMGGGLIFALHCDFIYAAENAKISMPEVKLGLVGGTVNIPRICGKNKAKELLFTGRTITAKEAKEEYDLVNKVFPQEELMDAVQKVAQEIAMNAPFAVAQAKKLINMGLEVDMDTAFALEVECYNVAMHTEDRKEGVRAFNEKRKPVYTGH